MSKLKEVPATCARLKGFIDILIMLRDGKKSFNELKSLPFSPSTILTRLREGQKRGWIREDLSTDTDRRSKIAYGLTEAGKDALSVFDPVIDKYLELRKELEKLEEEARKREKDMKYLLISAPIRT